MSTIQKGQTDDGVRYFGFIFKGPIVIGNAGRIKLNGGKINPFSLCHLWHDQDREMERNEIKIRRGVGNTSRWIINFGNAWATGETEVGITVPDVGRGLFHGAEGVCVVLPVASFRSALIWCAPLAYAALSVGSWIISLLGDVYCIAFHPGE